MPDSPPASETLAAARALLREAIWTLAMAGVEVEMDGQPSRYVVDGRGMTEGEVVALASRIAPVRSERVQ